MAPFSRAILVVIFFYGQMSLAIFAVFFKTTLDHIKCAFGDFCDFAWIDRSFCDLSKQGEKSHIFAELNQNTAESPNFLLNLQFSWPNHSFLLNLQLFEVKSSFFVKFLIIQSQVTFFVEFRNYSRPNHPIFVRFRNYSRPNHPIFC